MLVQIQPVDVSGGAMFQLGAAQKLGSLTSFRGLAAIWVLIHNDVLFRTETGIDLTTGLIERGYLAVDFFLVLSGFVLAYVYSDKINHVLSRESFEFLVNRIARIYPLYLIVLLARAAFEFAKRRIELNGSESIQDSFSGEHSVHAFVANLLMIQAWGLYCEPTWIPSFWSISAEWFAYITFPVFLFVFRKAFNTAVAKFSLLLLLFSILTIAALGLNGGSLEFPYQYSLARCLPEFLIGIVLASFYRQAVSQNGKLLQQLITAANFSLIPLLILGTICVHFRLPDPIFLAIAMLQILLLAVASNRGHSLASARPLLYLGDISYAIYLLHMPVQNVWREGIGWLGIMQSPQLPYVGLVLKILVIVGLAAVLYQLVEIPARRRIRSLTWRKSLARKRC